MYIFSLDMESIMAEQRKMWDDSAPIWEKWLDVWERGAQKVNERLITLAEIQPGQKVLDIATGHGEPALTVAQKVGPEGYVVATDFSPQMLSIAKDRAKKAKVKNVDFKEVRGDTIGVTEKDFDAILCRWGFMFLPKLVPSLMSMRELLMPGGCLSSCVWGKSSRVPMLTITMKPWMKVFGFALIKEFAKMALPMLIPVLTGKIRTPSPFNLSNPVKLRAALRKAGFINVRTEKMTIVMEFSSADEFGQWDMDVGVGYMISSKPEKKIEMVRQGVTKAVERFKTTDGRIRIPCEVLCAVGYK